MRHIKDINEENIKHKDILDSTLDSKDEVIWESKRGSHIGDKIYYYI